MSSILRIAGPSNSGKTTFCLQLLELFQKNGVRVGYIKHSHHNPSLPSQKDSEVLWNAGVESSLMIGPDHFLLHQKQSNRSPLEWIAFLQWNDDVILVEGWRQYALPTILIAPKPLEPEWTLPSPILGVHPDSHPSNLPTVPRMNPEHIVTNIEKIGLKMTL